ncbi:hypothetical protein ABT040_17205 [Streptomyces sp. NPDC002688]|uniref:hypothetical protein n=1 Tax=Streptomyces sp. NPDC002688 TaxID=3154423 RepID=UPI003333AABF
MPCIRRRWAALAVLAGILLSPTVPAQAAGPAVELKVPDTAYLPERNVSPSGGIRLWLAPQPGAGRATQSDVTLTVDASDLEDIARLRTRRECGDHTFGSTDVVTCTLGSLTRGKDNYPDAIYIEALPGVSRGSHGTIRYTFSAPGADDSVFETDVRIEGPDLRARQEKPRKGDTAGASFDFTPQVRNAGRFPAKGFGMLFQGSRVTFPVQYSNCRYALQSPGSFADCWFDEQLMPGQAYELVEPVAVHVPDSMVNGSFQYKPFLQGMTGNAEEIPGATGTDPGMRQGTGPELKVRPVDSPAGAFGKKYRLGDVRLHTSQTADLQVSADTIEGTTGSTAPATFRLHNAGPGRMSGTALRVTVPEGLSVVAPTPPPDPDNESEWQWECYGPQKRAYTCGTLGPLEPGETWQTTLEFRIDRRVRGAEGLVEVIYDPERPSNDPKNSDNAAPIEVRATGGPLAEPSEPNPKPKLTPKPAAATVRGSGNGDSMLLLALAIGAAIGGGALALRLRARAVRRGAEPTGPDEN